MKKQKYRRSEHSEYFESCNYSKWSDRCEL